MILERTGPFSSARFRLAVVETLGWRDVSVGARLADGAQAAIPLLARGGRADSMPPSAYGEIATSRPLDPIEEQMFLEHARRLVRTTKLTLRALGDTADVSRRRHLGNASVVPIDRKAPGERYSRLARRSLRRASEAGAAVSEDDAADAFLALYQDASKAWHTRYSSKLLARLVADGTARIDIVGLDSHPVAGLLTVLGHSHWMCWLAAQSAAGRQVSASYLAYDAVFKAARAAEVPMVNLGVSVGGGVEFKRHLGASQIPMYETVVSTPVARTRDLTRAMVGRVSGRIRIRRGGRI